MITCLATSILLGQQNHSALGRSSFVERLTAVSIEDAVNEKLQTVRKRVFVRSKSMNADAIVKAYKAALSLATKQPTQTGLVTCSSWLEALSLLDGKPVLPRTGEFLPFANLFVKVQPKAYLEVQRAALISGVEFSSFPTTWRPIQWEPIVSKLIKTDNISALLLIRMSSYVIEQPHLASKSTALKIEDLWKKEYQENATALNLYYVVRIGYRLTRSRADELRLRETQKLDNTLRKMPGYSSLGQYSEVHLNYARRVAILHGTGKDPGK